ncbi:MAG: hypothetical protein EHM93_16015 [Bacteroidales bacterium]|nr:MAG: hypothetical protein EHM93_16015 [Bacteroidales bacterium]
MKTDPILITFKELRQAVGWLGILLPFVLAILLYALTCCSIQDSISQYYYTRMGSYLTGTLCAVGLFLIAYKGYPGENDSKFCNFAGACAFGVAFIPMQLNVGDVPCPDCIVFFTQGDHWWRIFHFVSAGLLFLTMAYMSYFKFTLSNEETVSKGTKKYTRNTIYKICGIIIFICILFLLVYNIIKHFNPDIKINTLTFFLESVMLIAFGTSWLVKGEGVSFLND